MTDASGETEKSPIQAVLIPVTPFQQNCSLLWCTETMRGAVTDPGGDLELVGEAIKEKSVTVEKILITHGHLDHAGGAKDLADKLGVPVEGPHEDDIFWISQMEEQSHRFGFAGAKVFEPDRWLTDGDTVTFGNVSMDVIHCPGHTPGHVVFIHKGAGLAVVGDVLFQGSIGRTDFPKGNHDDLIASIRKKLFPLGDDITFIPGHGPLSTFGHERQSNPYVSDIAIGFS